jgi:hypothetical protein
LNLARVSALHPHHEEEQPLAHSSAMLAR